MGKISNDDLGNTLIAEKIIDATGTVNATTVNYISGAFTMPLLGEVWDLYLHDIDAMKELQAFLNEVYKKEQFDILIGIMKILYGLCSVIIPGPIQMIFNCNKKDLKELYLYEFLQDFQDIMYDLRTDSELI